MKSRCLVLSIFGALLLSSSAHASSQPLAQYARLTGMSPAQQLARHVLGMTTRSSRVHTSSHGLRAPVGQDASQMALPASAFSPAKIASQSSGVQTNEQADKEAFRVNHSKSYADLARVTGYFQRADWRPSGTTDTVTIRYQGSIFASVDTAHGAWQDGVTTTQSLSGSAPTDCTSQAKVTCSFNGFAAADGATVLYFVLQYNQCLVETSIAGSQAVLLAQQNQLVQIGATVTAGGIAAAQAACSTPAGTGASQTPVDFAVISVRVHKKTKIANPNKASLGKAKLGKQVYLYIYYHIGSAPDTARMAVTFTIVRSGKVVGVKTFPHGLLAPPPNDYYEDAPYKPSKTGTYTVTTRLTVNGQAKEGKVSFKVVK